MIGLIELAADGHFRLMVGGLINPINPINLINHFAPPALIVTFGVHFLTTNHAMKYRRLQQDELESLEKDFIRFLATNQVTASEWEKLKDEESEKVEKLIRIFSDIVFEKVLNDVQYLEYKTPKDIKTFHFEEDRIVMNGLLVEGQTSFDFTLEQSPQQMLQQIQLTGAKLKLYTAEKAYSRARNMEIFEMIENGALISKDGGLFRTLEGLKGE
ncbi:MAG: hypothetical protein H6556_20480 [Lewinellaceae bacterium]|nr:hypothetical protein [Lewinellaceae bacterium]